MGISAKDVMALRQRTGVGMMACKAALEEADGDAAVAVELLREKLKGDMDERTDRQASEGVVAISKNDTSVAMVELLSETDFAARNDKFVQASQQIVDHLLNGGDGERTSDDHIKQTVDELRITIKENISMGAAIKFSGSRVGSYLHHNRQVGAIVMGEGELGDELMTGICQHLVAAVPPLTPHPLGVDEASLSEDLLAQQNATFVDEARDSGKPDSIIEKMVTGKMRKWVNEHTLLGQTYIRELDAKKPVAHYLPPGASIHQFMRFQVGRS